MQRLHFSGAKGKRRYKLLFTLKFKDGIVKISFDLSKMYSQIKTNMAVCALLILDYY